jgi:hypothetical protein
MLAAVGCMLLIGCLNVSNLLVARGAARQKKVAIRSALGAQRATLIREQLTESVLICAAGGLCGIFVSLLATRLLAHAWKNLPSAQGIYIDGSVIAPVYHHFREYPEMGISSRRYRLRSAVRGEGSCIQSDDMIHGCGRHSYGSHTKGIPARNVGAGRGQQNG